MVDFSVLVLSGAHATSVAMTLDMLDAAARLAPRVGRPRPTWRVLSPDGGTVVLRGGVGVPTRALPARPRAEKSTWIIPGLGVDQPGDLAMRLARDDACKAVAAVSRHAAQGGAVAASCSAVFLLQAAGILRARHVTTSWWLASALRRLGSDCRVDADRMVCVDGPVTTAGAAFAQADLVLHLLRTRFGAALADLVARMLLIDGRRAQSPFVVPAMLSGGNELVAGLTARIERALPDPPSVADLARQFSLSPRTLARHVRAATGQGTLALVQGVRLNRARLLIENSRMSIEQVAAQVGYEDATALRRLMRKVAGTTPSRFRVRVQDA